jgi:serine/threonine protein kinase
MRGRRDWVVPGAGASAGGQVDRRGAQSESPTVTPDPAEFADMAYRLLDGEILKREDVDPSSPAFGRYRLMSPLGQGASSEVVRAYDPKLDRGVAIKILRREASERTRSRFLQEARFLASLTHGNLVRVHEVGSSGGRAFYVMDLVEGVTLDKAAVRLDWGREEWIKVMMQVALACQAAHERGIIHRDIKPANILLNPAGEPVLVDFGVALSVERETRQTEHGAYVGTLAYMAPDQLEGEANARTDVYSLGAVLYEGLCGQLPRPASSKLELIKKLIERVSAPPIRDLAPDTPLALSRVVDQAVHADPVERQASARQFAEQLYTSLRAPAGHEPARWGVAPVVLVSAILCVLASSALLFSWRDSPADAPVAQKSESAVGTGPSSAVAPKEAAPEESVAPKEAAPEESVAPKEAAPEESVAPEDAASVEYAACELVWEVISKEEGEAGLVRRRASAQTPARAAALEALLKPPPKAPLYRGLRSLTRGVSPASRDTFVGLAQSRLKALAPRLGLCLYWALADPTAEGLARAVARLDEAIRIAPAADPLIPQFAQVIALRALGLGRKEAAALGKSGGLDLSWPARARSPFERSAIACLSYARYRVRVLARLGRGDRLDPNPRRMEQDLSPLPPRALLSLACGFRLQAARGPRRLRSENLARAQSCLNQARQAGVAPFLINLCTKALQVRKAD